MIKTNIYRKLILLLNNKLYVKIIINILLILVILYIYFDGGDGSPYSNGKSSILDYIYNSN